MTEQTQAQLMRCLQCKNPGCSAACPLGNDIPTIVRLVREGKFVMAVQVVGHPFGGVCGYVCPHENQCQGGCVLAKRGQAVPTGEAEAAAFTNSPYVVARRDDKLAGRRVAVVGGGVSGITFAVKCYESGADVTVYESNMLLSTLYGIPEFRLPHRLLDDIVRSVEQSDIRVEHKYVCQADIAAMQNDNDIVYLAVGRTVCRALGVTGEEYATTADKFLHEAMLPRDVIVVGGGNTAMDCARLNARLGGKTMIAYRRAMADMPCYAKEVQAAADDGVMFETNLAPVMVDKQADGRLSVTFARTNSEGRGRLSVTDELHTFSCDCLVVAAGNMLDGNVYAQDKTVPVDKCGNVDGNLYAGGDCAGGSLVVEAVKAAICACNGVFERYATK
ncbi:MAG TPA: hypothetical protein DHU79_01495 [Clostridiales bacterium]|nr:hypothetical protein [Clostridiales bacterium]